MLKKFNHIRAGIVACLLIFNLSFSQDIINKALELKLYENKQWLKLLHYKNGKSEIDSQQFFFSEVGKINSKDELITTINAFLNSQSQGDDHPICKFPARFYFLDKYLHLKDKLKIYPKCTKLHKFLKEVEPFKISFIFADGYLSSPASMYGHTFLRIDTKYKSPLISTAVNFAARADASDGLMYYFKGIFGLYKGYYTDFKYYRKIYEYGNLEKRDLWEYSLNLTPEEAYFIALHVWELKNQYSYYYFFNKNCSYYILYLIDIARPDLDLINQTGLTVIPIDTVRLLKNKNLVKSVRYRPSPVKKINYIVSDIDDISNKEINLVKNVAKFKSDPKVILSLNVSKEKKAKLLDLSKELFFYYAVKEKMPLKEYRKKLLVLLKTRSKVRYRTKYKIDNKYSPETGHLSHMFSYSYGFEEKNNFISLYYRSAYHSIYDYSRGYIFGSEIIFPSFEFRIFPEINKIVLDDFTFIKIKSYSIRNKIFKPYSWEINTYLKRRWNEKGEKELFFRINPSYGISYGKENSWLFYSGISTDINLGLSYLKNDSFLAFGLKNVFLYEKNKHKFVISLIPEFQIKENSNYFGYYFNGSYNYAFRTNFAIFFSYSLENLYEKTFNEGRFSLKFYF